MKLIIFVLVVFTKAISFIAKEGIEKCFSDEVPSRTFVIIYHELKGEGISKNNDKREMSKMIQDGIKFIVYDPEGAQIQNQDVTIGPNKITFNAKSMGRYKFCVFKSKKFWSQNEYKYSIKIQQGVSFELTDAANTTHVQTLQERIESLKNRTEDFIKLQQLNRDQEDKLTTQSITINNRVTQTTLLQILVLVVSGAYQIYSLRKFFKIQYYYIYTLKKFLQRGQYQHRVCSSVEREINLQVSPVSSPISWSMFHRNKAKIIKWPKANDPKLKLNNFDDKGQYIPDKISYRKLKRERRVSASLYNEVSNFIKNNMQGRISTPQTKPQTILVRDFTPRKSLETSKFYTTKYMGVYQNQMGVLSRKCALESRDSRRPRSVSAVVHEEEYIVNKYLIPRKLGQK